MVKQFNDRGNNRPGNLSRGSDRGRGGGRGRGGRSFNQ